MMRQDDLPDVLWSVAARFGFGERELWAMPISRLMFWYDGALKLAARESALIGGK